MAGRGAASAAARPPLPRRRPPSSGWPRSSTSWPGCRSRPRSWSGTCSRRASPATSRGCSTSSARWARSPGWGGGASAATTAGSRSSGRAASCCGRSGRPTARSRRRSRVHERDPRAPRGARRLVLPRAVRGGARDVGPRGARRAVGPRLGRRGHQRHVRAAARAALEADRRAAASDRRPARPADRARAARGRRPLVAGRCPRRPTRRPPTERLHAQSLALLERHGVVTREAVATEGDRGRVRGRLPGPAGDGGGRPDPARLLRRRAGGRPVRARRARSTGCARRASRPSRPASGAVQLLAAADPGEPVRRGPRLAAPRRDRPAAAPARGRRVRRPGRRRRRLYLDRGGSTLQTLPAADDPAVAVAALRALRDARRRRAGPRARHPQGRRRATSAASPFRDAAARGRVRGRLSRARAPCRPGPAPECPRATRSSGPPRDCGRTWSGGRSPRHGPAGPAPVPQVARIVGRRDHRRRGDRQEPPDPVRQRPRDPDAPADERLVAPLPAGRALAPAGRPGAARPRGPGRGRGLLRCPGRRALRAARRGAPPVALAARAGPARARLRRRRGRPPAARPGRARTAIAEALLDQRALAGIGNVYKNEMLWIERVSPFATVADLDDAALTRLVDDRPPAAGRQRPRPRADRNGSRPVATAARRVRCTSTGGPGVPAAAAGRRSSSAKQGAEIPRTTYWCPICQPDPV